MKTGLLRLWIAASILWMVGILSFGVYSWWSYPWRVVDLSMYGKPEPDGFIAVVVERLEIVGMNVPSALAFMVPHLIAAVGVPLVVLALGRMAIWVVQGFQQPSGSTTSA